MVKKSVCIISILCLIGIAGLALNTSDALAKTQFISIGTGGTGGVYYPYGGGLAEIWTKYVKGVKAVAEVTGASVENVRLADKGETVVGLVMGDVAYQAYYADGRFKGKPQKIYAMFMMYPNLYQVVVLKDSGIKSIYDVKGKNVSVGSPGSGTEFMTNLVFEALGIPYSEFKVHRLSFVENANALHDKTIDVGIWCVAPGTSSIMDLATTHSIEIIPFTPEEQKKVCDKYTFYAPFDVPAGTYNGIDKPVPTVSVWNVVICTQGLSDDLVYNLTKTVFEHQKYLMQIHPFAKYTTPENAIKTSPIPFHPGAVKYFKEIGLTVPPRLMPK